MSRRAWRLVTVAGLTLAAVSAISAWFAGPHDAPGGGHVLGFTIGGFLAVWSTAEAERAGRDR